MESQASKEMPCYQSYKKVHALLIKSVSAVSDHDGSVTIEPADSRFAPFVVDRAYVTKHEPKAGGYYVVYDDGYASWSPAKAFEEGYTLLYS